MQWDSLLGWERLFVQSTGKGSIEVDLSPGTTDLEPLHGTKHATTVGGRPATVALDGGGASQTSQVRWQPEAGLWAQAMLGGDEQAARSVAEEVRIDRVYRCAVPFRLGPVPSGTAVQGCRLTLDGTGAFQSVGATVGTSSWSMTLEVYPGQMQPATTTLAGHPASVEQYPGDGGHQIMSVSIDLGGHTVNATVSDAYDAQAVLAAMNGYREVSRCDDPDAWSGGPLD